MPETQDPRPKNRRGEGGRLRDEIVQAATDMLDEGLTEEAVTLRAVARRVQIAPQSIYTHFADRDAILLAVIQRAFAELGAHLRAAIDESDGTSRGSLIALCESYTSFALESANRYRILFGGVWNATRAKAAPSVGSIVESVGLDVFDLFIDALGRCAAEGLRPAADVREDATALWVGLHGYATLRPATPEFPWPGDLVARIVPGLSKVV